MARKEARQRRSQKRKEASLSAMRRRLSPEDLADAERREMNTDELISQYVTEIKEVSKADERLKKIDRAILGLSTERQRARENRLAVQKRELTREDIAMLMG